MKIPESIIKETKDGYHILRSDVRHVFDKPISVVGDNNKELDLIAIFPERDNCWVFIDTTYNSYLDVKVKVEKSFRPMNSGEMKKYCMKLCEEKGQMLFVTVDNINLYPWTNHIYCVPPINFKLTWDGVNYFYFPEVEVF